jgi:hypothetical protein
MHICTTLASLIASLGKGGEPLSEKVLGDAVSLAEGGD